MITTPFIVETIGRSPSFIGGLVGSISTTVIAVTFFVTLLILVQALQLHIPFQVSNPNTLLFIVSLCCKFSLTHIDITRPFISTTNELYSIGSLHQKTFNEVFAHLEIFNCITKNRCNFYITSVLLTNIKLLATTIHFVAFSVLF